MAEALGYVHEHHRLHLDIKPGNVMIDDHDQAILIDFGASKQYDEENGENTSTLMGKTPGYAPIEQMSNSVQTFCPATDIYALGATLYKLLTGQNPPDATSIINDGFPGLPSQISKTTKDAILLAMEVRKTRRPQSIDEWIEILNIKSNTKPLSKELENTIFETKTQHISLQKNEEAPFNNESENTILETKSRSDSQPENKGTNTKQEPNKDENSNPRKIVLYCGAILIGLVCLFNIFKDSNNLETQSNTSSISQEQNKKNNEQNISSLNARDYSLIEIGDYFYSDGSFSHEKENNKECVGIVFSLETTEEEKKNGWTHGQIIALNDAGNGKYTRWGPVNSDLPAPHTTYKMEQLNDAIYDYNGFLYSNSSYVNKKQYQAFEFAKNYTAPLPNSPLTSGWYLPSIGQWYMLLQNLCGALWTEDFRNFSIKNNPALLEKDEGYWSSTESDSGFAWFIGFYSEVDGFTFTNPKNSRQLKVRAIAAF